jgi:hypothetical protein
VKRLLILGLLLATALPCLSAEEEPDGFLHLLPLESAATAAPQRDPGGLVAWGLFGGTSTFALGVLTSLAVAAMVPDSGTDPYFIGLVAGGVIGGAVSIAVPLFAASPPIRKKAWLASLIGGGCGFLVAEFAVFVGVVASSIL